MRKIETRAELVHVARELGVRPDWHEPDEQAVTATVSGRSFDNAGFWGHEFSENPNAQELIEAGGQEMYVTLFSGIEDGKPVPYATVNLATLFAWATGYEYEIGLQEYDVTSDPEFTRLVRRTVELQDEIKRLERELTDAQETTGDARERARQLELKAAAYHDEKSKRAQVEVEYATYKEQAEAKLQQRLDDIRTARQTIVNLEDDVWTERASARSDASYARERIRIRAETYEEIEEWAAQRAGEQRQELNAPEPQPRRVVYQLNGSRSTRSPGDHAVRMIDVRNDVIDGEPVILVQLESIDGEDRES